MTHEELLEERDKSNLYALYKRIEEKKLPIQISYYPDVMLWRAECSIYGEPYVVNGDIRSIAANLLEKL